MYLDPHEHPLVAMLVEKKERKNAEPELTTVYPCCWPRYVVSSFPMRPFVFSQLFDILAVLIPLLFMVFRLLGILL